MAEYHCTYRDGRFPVDEFGRLGGLYSLADLPIMEHKQLSRTWSHCSTRMKNDSTSRFVMSKRTLSHGSR